MRGLLAVFFVVAGSLHFLHPEAYLVIMPPFLPEPRLLVAVSGLCETAGGIGILFPRVRRVAGWGLIALLVAVFPANIYAAVARVPLFGLAPAWLWARLPFQILFIAWVWWCSLAAE
jgi:uncharacterized membrane protein